MKRLIYISLMLLIQESAYCQQFPSMEGYNMNPFNLSPSFAGIQKQGAVFADYRSDWTGVAGGPVTCQLSYNDRFFEKVGIGARFIYDQTDIFKQIMLLGTYTYEVTIAEEHLVNFGLSVGFYRNSIDMAKYYSDPGYVQDNVLMYGLQKSKIKFASDMSFLYRFQKAEAGLLFSNLMFGSAKYNSTDISYKPMKNYLVHMSYRFDINKSMALKPYMIVRGGQNYPVQFEFSSEFRYLEKYWIMALFRTGGVWGMGLGGEIYKGILLNYSYNLSTNVAMNTFGSHQFTLGFRIPDSGKTDTKTHKK
jgi:type IX secretion system PorP/SprF family membrane protein